MMFRGSTQRPSFFSTVPEGPNLLKVHFVTYTVYVYVTRTRPGQGGEVNQDAKKIINHLGKDGSHGIVSVFLG